MAHGLTSSDSMFSVREMPWHGLGVVLKKSPSGVQDALKKAGLDWKVEKVPLQLAAGRHAGQEMEGWFATVRQDTGQPLGVVSDRYEIVQNVDAFRFVDNLIGSAMHFETAGSLHAGATTWVLARVPDHITVGGDTVVEYVLFRNRHDGKGAVQVLVTAVRVVCANTLGMALDGAEVDSVYTVRHVGEVKANIAEARRVMKMTVDFGKQFAKFGNRLASQKMTERKLNKVVDELLVDRAASSKQRARDAVVHLFLEGDTIGNAPGSKWAGLNAVTEYLDYGRKVKSADSLFDRTMLDVDGLKRRAAELVIAV
jgi:phage/plasmid-like protein (TIGR03299 family)